MVSMRSRNEHGLKLCQVPLGLFSVSEAAALLDCSGEDILIAAEQSKVRLFFLRPKEVSVLCVERKYDRRIFLANEFSRDFRLSDSIDSGCGNTQPDCLMLAAADCTEMLENGFVEQSRYYTCGCIDGAGAVLELISIEPCSLVSNENSMIDRYFLTISEPRLRYNFFRTFKPLVTNVKSRLEDLHVCASDLINYITQSENAIKV